MRFKALLPRESATSFSHIISALIKVTSAVIGLVVTPQGLELKANSDGLVAYSKLSSDDAFLEFHVSSKAADIIAMELDPKTLFEALRSSDKAERTELALTMKQNLKCLTITAESPNGFTVIQDVPISKLLRVEEMEAYCEPCIPDPEICLELPDLRKVKAVLERIKSLEKFLKIRATERGELVFKIENEMLQTVTTFASVKVELGDEEPDRKRSRHVKHVTVSASVQDLFSVMGALALKPQKVVLALAEKSVMVWHVSLNQATSSSLVYLLPTTEVSEEEF